MTHTAATGERIGARDWLPILNAYRTPNQARSLLEIVITAGPFVLLWAAMWASLQWSYWLTLAIAVPTAGFLVRLFMIQHDCGHGSFFRRRFANDWTGRAISVLTLTPYDHWKRCHAVHHASSGNLEERGIGDIKTLTVAEYSSLPRWRQIAYRLYRNPIVMFVIGPAYLFIIQNRFPNSHQFANWRAWRSPMATNAAIAALVIGVVWLVGLGPFLLIELPVIMLAASIGVWLFYVQHQFEETHWSRPDEWSVHDAALYGSSHYDLPALLRWFTANIGVHHVHHLCSRIPYYRLHGIMRAHPDLEQTGRLTLRQSLACVKLTLWDESQRRMISFRQFRAAQSPIRSRRA